MYVDHCFHAHAACRAAAAVCMAGLAGANACAEAGGAPAVRSKEAYVHAVTRGAGLLPWQDPGVSEAEQAFREEIERRKDALLAGRTGVEHPTLLDSEALARARRNIASAGWARAWFAGHKQQADFLAGRPDAYIDAMIPELSPGNTYGATCPNCVGDKSQEAAGASEFAWDSEHPDTIRCRRCGQVYPDERFPETGRIECPRSEQTFTCYLNEAERAHPEDRTGRLAYHWVGHPLHVSFSAMIRARKISFMASGVESLAYAYALTGDGRYAETGVRILIRFAECYRHWLYCDYWDTVADCDALYAAWHDRALPIEWKRHLSEQAFEGDELDRARMLQGYWGAGRFHPSTDAISGLHRICLAYDLLYDASGADGAPLWTTAARARVERDLILEWIMGAEPYLGGPGKAECVNNKAPRIYRAMAAAGRALGLPEYADVALRGYRALRDQSFLYDGFSRESPAYTNMYLSSLIWVPETLHGFPWPAEYDVEPDLYATDARLRLMLRAMIDQVDARGHYLPLSDTNVAAGPSCELIEVGMARYPEYFAGKHPALSGGSGPTDYAVFHLDGEAFAQPPDPRAPEILYPAWMTAFLRHGAGRDAAVLALTFPPAGGHRHIDNLALCYRVGGVTVLGDHGYVGDMPVNRWIRSTHSHNLVVVDDGEQRFRGDVPRMPSFRMMATSPFVSVVEASSDCYSGCTEYRRLVALIKGPGADTFAVDIFRVKGGATHAYRVFSEIAASDAEGGGLRFDGLDMPPEPPLPEVGQSLAEADIFGLRDVRAVQAPPAAWQAVWTDAGHAYRLWMCAPVHAVEAANGPGQTTRANGGRRVRYVDAVRTAADAPSTDAPSGEGLASVFVAVHEPGLDDGTMPITRVERLAVPEAAGAEAVALRIESAWGTFRVFNEFAEEAEIEGVAFQGDFGVVHEADAGPDWVFALGASTARAGGLGFAGECARWTGRAIENTEDTVTADTEAPAGWPATPDGCCNYLRAYTDPYWTGFPIEQAEDARIRVGRFPLPGVSTFEVRALRLIQNEGRPRTTAKETKR
ncbi:MAG: heparinase II/III family protein [Candidatus Hydrogenedentes bacterium]|nr:heparinase II/III family protein [Candidatus Hydrogenedentota bacterium]